MSDAPDSLQHCSKVGRWQMFARVVTDLMPLVVDDTMEKKYRETAVVS